MNGARIAVWLLSLAAAAAAAQAGNWSAATLPSPQYLRLWVPVFVAVILIDLTTLAAIGWRWPALAVYLALSVVAGLFAVREGLTVSLQVMPGLAAGIALLLGSPQFLAGERAGDNPGH